MLELLNFRLGTFIITDQSVVSKIAKVITYKIGWDRLYLGYKNRYSHNHNSKTVGMKRLNIVRIKFLQCYKMFSRGCSRFGSGREDHCS